MRKGVSPLIAAVLLIAFTVAVATLIMGWFTTFTRGTTESITNKTDTAIDCSSASINIQRVFVDTAVNGTIRANVHNTGFTNGLQLVSAQYINSTGSNITADNSLPATLDRGDSVLLNFTAPRDEWVARTCPGGFDRILVTTQCGGVSDTFDEAPKCIA